MTNQTYQPPPITGYRQLSADEVALINEIKAAGAQLGALVDKVDASVVDALEACTAQEQGCEEAFGAAEPFRWLAIARTDLQKGLMALARAVARPVGF